MSAVGSLGLLIRWRALQMRSILPLALLVQAMIGGALIIGDGLLIPHIDHSVATYLTAGAATLALVSVGIAIAPQFVAQARLTGLHDYLESLPLPRLNYLIAEVLVALTISVPGVAVALGIAELRYGVAVHWSAVLVLAVVMVLVTATAIGYAIGLWIKNPKAVTLVVNALLFFILLFTPIDYPISRLPTWLADAERVLPFFRIGELMRDTIVGSGPLLVPMLITGGWAVVAGGLCVRAALVRS